MEEALKPYRDGIESSEQWKGRGMVWVGPTPAYEFYSIYDYLGYYSEREGLLGKIAGCVYRCFEKLKEIFRGESTRLTARYDLAELIWQERKISTGTYKAPEEPPIDKTSFKVKIFIPGTLENIPQEIFAEADGGLAEMLRNFNAKINLG